MVRMVIAGSSPRPRRRNDSTPATTATIIMKTTSEGRFSPHSERLGPITALASSRRTFWPGRSAWTPAVTTTSPGARPDATSTRVGSDERISIARAATVPVFGSTTHTEACRSERVTADGGISIAAAAARLRRAVTVRAEAHRRRRIDQPDPEPEGAGDRIGARRDFPHDTLRGDLRIRGQGDDDFRIRRRDVLDPRRHVEDRVARALARDLDDHAPGADHLAGLRALRRHHPGHGGRPAGCSSAGSRRA